MKHRDKRYNYVFNSLQLHFPKVLSELIMKLSIGKTHFDELFAMYLESQKNVITIQGTNYSRCSITWEKNKFQIIVFERNRSKNQLTRVFKDNFHDLFCYHENYQYQVFSKWNPTFQKELKQVVVLFQKGSKGSKIWNF